MRVVVVDDEKIIADTLAMIMNHWGFRALPAYSGEAAVTVARKLEPHLLITDLIMGEMGGIHVAQVITKILPECQVVFMTAQTNLSDTIDLRIDGRDIPVLQKPFKPEELLGQIDKLCRSGLTPASARA